MDFLKVNLYGNFCNENATVRILYFVKIKLFWFVKYSSEILRFISNRIIIIIVTNEKWVKLFRTVFALQDFFHYMKKKKKELILIRPVNKSERNACFSVQVNVYMNVYVQFNRYCFALKRVTKLFETIVSRICHYL